MAFSKIQHGECPLPKQVLPTLFMFINFKMFKPISGVIFSCQLLLPKADRPTLSAQTAAHSMLVCSLYGEFQSNFFPPLFIDSNLSIVCSILTLFGALLRRCHNSCPVIDTCILPSLHKTGVVVDFLWWFFFFWKTTRGIYKGGRQTLFTKARCSAAAWDIPGRILVLLSRGSLHNDYSHMCLSHFILSSAVM